MRCQDVSAMLAEELAGTAAHAPAVVLVEHPGPWAADAAAAADPQVAALAQVAARVGVRVQLVRRVRGSDRPVDGQPVVVLAAAGPRGGRAVRRRCPATDLAALPLAGLARGELPGTDTGWEPLTRLWAVCTHARRDACCASSGRPVAAALDAARPAGEVWETTHLGGHRFAATALLLPEGLVLGRLSPADLPAVTADVDSGRVPTRWLRGRAALPPAGQLAEAVLRRATGHHAAAAVVVCGVDRHTTAGPPDTPVRGRVTVTADVAGAPWRVVLDARPEPAARPVSCGADATHPAGFDVLEVAPADAPGRGPGGWDEAYRRDGEPGPPHPLVVRELARLAPGTALDLGAGSGRHALWLAGRGWQVDAVDFSPEAIRAGRRAETAADGAGRRPVRWRLGDARVLPRPSDRAGGWDLVLMARVALPDVLARAGSLLAPGGRLVLLGAAPGGTGDPRLHHDPAALRSAALAAGLRVESCRTHPDPGPAPALVLLVARRPPPRDQGTPAPPSP